MKGGETMSDNTSIRDKLVQDFVDNYMEKIFYFCLKKTSNRLDAEDLTQDIALNIIDGLNKGIIPNNYQQNLELTYHAYLYYLTLSHHLSYI